MTEPVDLPALRSALARATPGPWNPRGIAGPDEYPNGIADAELIVLLRNNADALLDAVEQCRKYEQGFFLNIPKVSRAQENR
jgi:hypothetical protein